MRHKLCALLVGTGLLASTSESFSQVMLGSTLVGEANGDFFGDCLDISANGSRIVIGGHMNDGIGIDAGHVRVFEYIGQFWVQIGNDIDAESAGDHFGRSVAISANGMRIAVGAHFNDGNGASSGHVRVFDFNGLNWIQVGSDIDGEVAGDQSGFSVDMNDSGNRLIIGSPKSFGNGSFSGQARAYEYNGSNWVQLGADIVGEAAQNMAGTAVAMSGDGNYFAVAAPDNGGNGQNSGHVRVFKFQASSTTGWVQLGPDIDGENAQDHSGSSIAISDNGSTIAIGAMDNSDNGPLAGHVRVFKFDGVSWSQIGGDIDGENAQEHFGASVALNSTGTRLVAGAPRNDDNDTDAGQVRIFDYDGANWVQVGSDINGSKHDRLGASVAMSAQGEFVLIGSPTLNGNTPGSAGFYAADVSLDVSDITTHARFKVYPNPSSGTVYFEGNQLISGSITDVSGKLIRSFGNLRQINIADLPAGSYYLILEFGDEKEVHRLIRS